jgi:hypothetical protein
MARLVPLNFWEVRSFEISGHLEGGEAAEEGNARIHEKSVLGLWMLGKDSPHHRATDRSSVPHELSKGLDVFCSADWVVLLLHASDPINENVHERPAERTHEKESGYWLSVFEHVEGAPKQEGGLNEREQNDEASFGWVLEPVGDSDGVSNDPVSHLEVPRHHHESSFELELSRRETVPIFEEGVETHAVES